MGKSEQLPQSDPRRHEYHADTAPGPPHDDIVRSNTLIADACEDKRGCDTARWKSPHGYVTCSSWEASCWCLLTNNMLVRIWPRLSTRRFPYGSFSAGSNARNTHGGSSLASNAPQEKARPALRSPPLRRTCLSAN